MVQRKAETKHDEFAFGSDGNGTVVAPYKVRNFCFDGLIENDGFKIKLYAIRRLTDQLAPGLLEVTRSYVADNLPLDAEQEGDHHNVGFAVLHQGEHCNWLLMHWWAHADICCQRITYSAPGGKTEFVTCTRPLHACVWEQVVISHEYVAWRENMLTTAPDPARYLGAVLADGEY